jgi:hypothetical protein
MKPTTAVRTCLVWSTVLCAALGVQYVVAAQTTPSRPQSAAQAAPARQLFAVTVTQIKPELITEWTEWQKSEVMPTLQKGGVKERHAWRTVIGESFEYAMVTPLASFAERDGQSPIVKALGDQGAQAYGAKNRRFVNHVRTFVIAERPDLSYAPEMKEAPKLAVISMISVTPGRLPDYETHVKTDVLPLQKQAQSLGYLVSQTVFGGDGNEYVSLTLANSFADFDKGPAAIRVLGAAGAAKLSAKATGIIAHVERIVARYDPDLSFRVGSSTSK